MAGSRPESAWALRHRVGAAIRDRDLWGPGDRVAVAVSGGIDSVVLLDVLAATRAWHGADLLVATVDHGTRPESAEDAEFVTDRAEALGLPSVRLDLSLGAGADEERCRSARYEALFSLNADRIATAHHRDDQAETLIVQLLRGAGTDGLAGMPWRRDRLVRPLLGVSRAEIGEWAAFRGLAWREDPTNASPRFLRNRVRAEVLPLLEGLRPGVAETLARSAARVAEDAELIREVLAAEPRAQPGKDGFLRAWIADGPPALVRRALAAAAPGLTSPQLDAIRDLARQGSGKIGLGRGRVARADQDRLWIGLGGP